MSNPEAVAVAQPISAITIHHSESVYVGHTVGDQGVTKIELVDKPGLHCNLPYVRVWAGDRCIGEWCQHGIVGIEYAPDQGALDSLVAMDRNMGALAGLGDGA